MFSSKNTCDIVGISYRQLDYWARQGFFCPTQGAAGSGSRRQYSFADLVSLKVIKKMLDSGMNLQEVRKATDYLSAQGQDFSNASLVMSGSGVFFCDMDNSDELFDVLKGGQGVLTFVKLPEFVGEIESDVAAHIGVLTPAAGISLARDIA